MELLAVLVMIVAGGALALFFLTAFALGKAERGGAAGPQQPLSSRDEIAASILHQVLVAGGVPPDESLKRVRRDAGLGAPVTASVDVANWGETYARAATAEQRAWLLETAVRLAAARPDPLPLRQYSALLDLSFGLGFRIDALARLREQYGFQYVDHAKDGRPRSADRAGGATTLYARDAAETSELLRLLGIEGKPTRQEIVSAYRRLAAEYHPDRHQGETEAELERSAARFIEITLAYEKLLAIYRD